MVDAGKERCGRAGDWINVRVDPEGNIVRDEESSIPAADHRLGVKGVGEAQPRHELRLGKWQTVAAGVGAGPNQENISWTGAARGATAAGHRGICDLPVPVSQSVVAFRPGALQFVP